MYIIVRELFFLTDYFMVECFLDISTQRTELYENTQQIKVLFDVTLHIYHC